jgi:acyl carrier protein
MTNLAKYNSVFTEALGVEVGALENLKYQDVRNWDSVGHMHLMSSLEEIFEIELDIDDIIEFSSYLTGKVILSKYNIKI